MHPSLRQHLYDFDRMKIRENALLFSVILAVICSAVISLFTRMHWWHTALLTTVFYLIVYRIAKRRLDLRYATLCMLE